MAGVTDDWDALVTPPVPAPVDGLLAAEYEAFRNREVGYVLVHVPARPHSEVLRCVVKVQGRYVKFNAIGDLLRGKVTEVCYVWPGEEGPKIGDPTSTKRGDVYPTLDEAFAALLNKRRDWVKMYRRDMKERLRSARQLVASLEEEAQRIEQIDALRLVKPHG